MSLDKAYDKKYYLNNKEKILENNRQWRKDNPRKQWCVNTTSRHRNRGCEILFTNKELLLLTKESSYCFLCGFELIYEPGRGFTNEHATLDRINNERILTLNNVQILCRRCNLTKQDRTMNEFIKYCKIIYNKFGGNKNEHT